MTNFVSSILSYKRGLTTKRVKKEIFNFKWHVAQAGRKKTRKFKTVPVLPVSLKQTDL